MSSKGKRSLIDISLMIGSNRSLGEKRNIIGFLYLRMPLAMVGGALSINCLGTSRWVITGTDEQKELFISSKEMLALVHAIRVLPEEIRDVRVDACVDSKAMIDIWEAKGARHPSS